MSTYATILVLWIVLFFIPYSKGMLFHSLTIEHIIKYLEFCPYI